MVKVVYNDQLVYKVVIWAFFGISLWTEKVALINIGADEIIVPHMGDPLQVITVSYKCSDDCHTYPQHVNFNNCPLLFFYHKPAKP